MRQTLLFLALILSMCGFAQGHLDVEQDSRIDQLVAKQGELYAIDSSLNGFRVQIFMEVGNDAIEHAEAAMEEFEKTYKDIPIYLSYGQPYYRLRIGDFRTRVDAERCLRNIRGKYTNAFVTADNINPPDAASSRKWCSNIE